ncbi:hypothetical protein HGRIS_005350 [Hohenbuehelia grisea]|uniref:Zn(2)-C6 fungal-type domain-containing protein n=1 Tax=Hohenbuehelia grisea TaxID=104357 RepID=A0ABR3JEY6_9AGAR
MRKQHGKKPISRLQPHKACKQCRQRKNKCKGGRPCTQCVLLEQEQLCVDAPGPKKKYLKNSESQYSPVPSLPEVASDAASDQEFESDVESCEDMDHGAGDPFRASTPLSEGQEARTLITESDYQTFLRYATKIGFFMHPQFFRSHIFDDVDKMWCDKHGKSQALEYAIYVWLATLAKPGMAYHGDAPRIADTAVTLAALEEKTIVPRRPVLRLHLLQAQILLGFYFLKEGKFLVASECTSTAISLAIDQWNWTSQANEPVKPSSFCVTSLSELLHSLTPDRPEATQLHPDILNVLLIVCGLNQMLAAVSSLSHNILFTQEITAWECYTEVDMVLPDLEAFIGAFPVFEDHRDCLANLMLLKSSIILREVNDLVRSLPPARGFVHDHEATPFCRFIEDNEECFVYCHHHERLSALLKTLTTHLDRMPTVTASSKPRPFALPRGICETIRMTLYRATAEHSKTAMYECVISANKIIESAASFFAGETMDIIDPFYGIIIVAACRVLMDNARLYPPPRMNISPGMQTYLQIGISLLERLASTNTIIRDQLEALREVY